MATLVSNVIPFRRPADRAEGARLGRGSLLHRTAGDWRSQLSGLSAGLLQLMHPDLGRGVVEHSAFFEDPWGRILRSIPQIWQTILEPDVPGPDGRTPGHRIRDLHTGISGTRPDGERYHALEPGTFWWAHATFTWEMLQVWDRWDHRPWTYSFRNRLYGETVTWYRRYGVSDRVVPPTLHAFEERFADICSEELVLTPAAERAIDLAVHATGPVPAPTEELGEALRPVLRLLALGGLPVSVRRRFDIPFSRTERLQFDAVVVAVRNLGMLPAGMTRARFLASLARLEGAAGSSDGPKPVS